MSKLTREQQIAALDKDWAENPRWKGIRRGYTAPDVVRLRGSVAVEHTLAAYTSAYERVLGLPAGSWSMIDEATLHLWYD